MAWGIVYNQMFWLIAFYCRSMTQGNLQLKIKNFHQIYLLSSGENPGETQLIDVLVLSTVVAAWFPLIPEEASL